MQKGIIVAGSIMIDKHFSIDTFPEEGSLVTVRETRDELGGMGNLILDIAKLDCDIPIKISGMVGSGSNGRFIKRCLDVYPNIDQQGLVIGQETSLTMVMDAQDTKQRTFFFYPGASDLYDYSCIDWDTLTGDIFHLEYLLLMRKIDAPDDECGTHGAKILREAQKLGMKTSIDIVSEISERAPGIVKAALRYSDYCTINEVEAQMVTGIRLIDHGTIVEEHMIKALEALHGFGVSTWVIVHSPNVSYGLDCVNGKFYKVFSLLLPKGYIKGTTGAGDAFCCGVLYAAYKGQSIVEGMKTGTMCATISLSELNGFDGMRPYAEVLKEYSLYKVDPGYEEL
jgi:sugar/nucleoside kinase (ribokinase family)